VIDTQITQAYRTFSDTVATLRENWGMRLVLPMIGWVLLLWLWANIIHAIPEAFSFWVLVGSLIPATVLFWQQPAYGIVALMFFASGFVPPSFVDIRLPVGGGFEMRDILLLLMFGLMFFRGLIHKYVPIPWMPVGLLVAAFFYLVVSSLINALYFENVPGNWALSDARILSFYLIFFIAAWGITERKALLLVIVGCFVIADITAGIVILQQRLGAYTYVLQSMRDGNWQVWATGSSAVRVVPPGILLMYFMNLISISLTMLLKPRWGLKVFLVLHSLFLSLALLLTYTRSAWVASAVALLIIVVFTLFIFRRYLVHIFIFGTATILFIVGTVGLIFDNPSVENEVMLDIINRFNSIINFDDTLESNSLRWRVFEAQQAAKAIREQPLTGVGLGNAYRPVTTFQNEAVGLWTDEFIAYELIDRFTRYVHTSYLAVTVKMGLPGIIVLVLIFVAAIIRGFIMMSRLNSRFAQGLTLAIVAGMIGMLQWSFLHAHLMLATSTATNGLLLGILAAIYTMYILPMGATNNLERSQQLSMIRRAIEFVEGRRQSNNPS
jgi:O-antigen ligase